MEFYCEGVSAVRQPGGRSRQSRTGANIVLSLMLRPGDFCSSCPLSRLLWQYLFSYFCYYYFLEATQQKSGGERRGPSHGSLLPGVGHSRESQARPKHPQWWQSFATSINNWRQFFTTMFLFPTGPEGYLPLYETNGCRLDARGLWGLYALMS